MNPISLPIAELKPALTGLGKIINRHAALPVLHQIKVERNSDGWIALTSTDLDRFITVRLEQPVKGAPIALLLPFEELVKHVKNGSRDQNLTVVPVDPTSVIIQHAIGSQVAEHRLQIIPAHEFPATPKFKHEALPLPPPLRHSILEAMQCASEDPARLVLQGAFLDVSDPKCQQVVATDGKHLYSSNSFAVPLKNSLLIPAHKFLGWKEFNTDGEWQMKVDPGSNDGFLQLSSRRWRFITRRISGNYPNWRQVLPDVKSTRTTITFDPRMIEQVIRLIERMPCHSQEHHTLGLEWKEGQLALLGKPAEQAPWTRVPIADAKGSGSNITVLLNRKLLIKALEFNLNTLGIIDEISPFRFYREGRQMIVMPVRPATLDTAKAKAPPPRLPAPKHALAAHGPPPPEPVAASRQAASRPRLITAPKIDDALNHVSSLRDSFRNGLSALRDLASKLKIIRVTQKTSEKEVQTVRSQLRQIQKVRL